MDRDEAPAGAKAPAAAATIAAAATWPDFSDGNLGPDSKDDNLGPASTDGNLGPDSTDGNLGPDSTDDSRGHDEVATKLLRSCYEVATNIRPPGDTKGSSEMPHNNGAH